MDFEQCQTQIRDLQKTDKTKHCLRLLVFNLKVVDSGKKIEEDIQYGFTISSHPAVFPKVVRVFVKCFVKLVSVSAEFFATKFTRNM